MEMESLIEQAKQGDKQAFAKLYEKVYIELYRFACYMLANTQDAEDVVSETIIDAYKGIKKLKDNKSFKSWLFKILSIKCKRKISGYYEKTVPLEEVGNVGVDTTEEPIVTDLKRVLRDLSYEERMIVTYNIIGGYNSREIAKILNLNRNTVRSKLNRSLDKIRNRMEDWL